MQFKSTSVGVAALVPCAAVVDVPTVATLGSSCRRRQSESPSLVIRKRPCTELAVGGFSVSVLVSSATKLLAAWPDPKCTVLEGIPDVTGCVPMLIGSIEIPVGQLATAVGFTFPQVLTGSSAQGLAGVQVPVVVVSNATVVPAGQA